MSKKDFLNPFTIVFGLIILLSVVGLGIVWVKVPKNNSSNNQQQFEDLLIKDVKVPPLRSEDWVKGDRSAPVVLIQYSDLECPVCKTFHPVVERVYSSYAGKVALAYRHYPIESIHKNAKPLAESVECAGRVSGSEYAWTMIDRIYEEMPGATLDDAKAIASDLKIEQTAFLRCLENHETEQAVESMFREGLSGDVKGTPTTFIFNNYNGRALGIPFALDETALKGLIDSFLATEAPVTPTTQGQENLKPEQ